MNLDGEGSGTLVDDRLRLNWREEEPHIGRPRGIYRQGVFTGHWTGWLRSAVCLKGVEQILKTFESQAKESQRLR